VSAYAPVSIQERDMLRITVQTEPDRIRLKLEGELAGPWVSEVEESWRATCAALGDRPLCLDLTDVLRVDRAGRYLLGLLRCCGAQLIASGIEMTELVRSINETWPTRNQGRPRVRSDEI
jgi:ABC-type transporter Mla MlaB component